MQKKNSARKLRLLALGIAAFFFAIQTTVAQPAASAIDGTTGAPLGGIGCGAIKFKASDGTFSQAFWSPCANNNSYQAMSGTRFQFYCLRQGTAAQTVDKLAAVVTNGRADDDAVYPVHTANFGTTNAVHITLTAFSPINLPAVNEMCYPYAFYQITLTNTGSTPVDAAVAFITTTPDAAFSLATGKGITSNQRTLYAATDDPAGILSAGNDNGFMTNGQCNNTVTGNTNKVAVKVTLAANQSRLVKFVLAWFNTGDPTRYFYSTVSASSAAFGDTGLAKFDLLRDNAVTQVTRMRASNLPDWIKNQALVTLCNLTNNAMYTQDRRYAHTEGMWNTNGTMDQMWHARQIYAQVVPSLDWQELYYWGSTQKTNPVGQIHHDLGGYGYGMCSWTDRQHVDYRTIDSWVDLNCAFIVSVYEAFIATDDHSRLDSLWPATKKAGQRIRDQLTSYGNTSYPGTFVGSQNSYDAGGNPDPYNSSMSLVTYKILSQLAVVEGDATTQQTYDAAFTTAADSFRKRYLTNNFPAGRISESVMAGQWLAYFLKLGELVPQANIDYALTQLATYYNPATNGLGYTAGTYDEWAPYLMSHYAGLLQQTNHQTEWKKMQYDWYYRLFMNRNMVYNQPLGIPAQVGSPTYLATDISGFNQYISVPVVWRNYYDMIGFHRNKHTGELWLEPILPDTIRHVLTNAFYFSPEGNGTISCTESGTTFQEQAIALTPDNAMPVTALYLRDKGLTQPYVYVNGTAQTYTRIGTGYAKELKVNWTGTIPSTGARIVVSGTPTSVKGTRGQQFVSPVFQQGFNRLTIHVPGAHAFTVTIMTVSGKKIADMHGLGSLGVCISSKPFAGAVVVKPGAYVTRVTWDRGELLRTMFLTR
jgi:uncharacterized protein (DUF608 family)